MTAILKKNIAVIKERFPHIYVELEKVVADDSYIGVEKAKNFDYLIPILFNGKAMHSKYSHKKESEKMFNGNEETVLFCGIGAGYHIAYFLDAFPQKKALLTDFSYASFKRLLELCDIYDILVNQNVILLPPVTESSFVFYFVQSYIPILMGSLNIVVLRVWRDFFSKEAQSNVLCSTTERASSVLVFEEKINFALNEVSQDLSTQARFGRIWMRNIILNLKEMSKISIQLPNVDTRKTAYILGAGPSLESKIEEMKKKRNDIVIFASDASFLPLLNNDIIPDFFISIDPQIACSTHCITSFSSNIIAVFDLAASPTLVRQFVNNGNAVIFTISHHPFSQYVSSFSALPHLDVSSGTVAIAALKLSYALGFNHFESAGLDFAYTHGKTYSKGVYLHNLYQKDVNRLTPEETCFASLMFRSNELEKVQDEIGITYRTELLDSYKREFQKAIKEYERNTATTREKHLWNTRDFSPFLYESFIEKFKSEASILYENASPIFLPFITWQKMTKRYPINKNEDFTKTFIQDFLTSILY